MDEFHENHATSLILGSPVLVNHYYLANLQRLILNRDYRDMRLLVEIRFIFFR